MWRCRDSRLQMFLKIGVLKNFAILTGKQVWWMQSVLNKVADLKACDFIEKRSQGRCFLVNIAKFLRTAFYRTPLVAASEYVPIISSICSTYPQGYTGFLISCSRVTFVSPNTFFLTKAFLKKFLKRKYLVGSCWCHILVERIKESALFQCTISKIFCESFGKLLGLLCHNAIAKLKMVIFPGTKISSWFSI